VRLAASSNLSHPPAAELPKLTARLRHPERMKGRAVTFQKVSDLDGQSSERLLREDYRYLHFSTLGMKREEESSRFFYEYMPARLSLCSWSGESSAANTAAASFDG
jgi:hypothetical protein